LACEIDHEAPAATALAAQKPASFA